MRVVRTIEELRAAHAEIRELAFVPTMGNLHAGHVALVRIARCQRTLGRQADAVDTYHQLASMGPARVAGAPAALGLGHAGLGLGQLDILPRGEHGQEEEPLEHETDPREPDPAALVVSEGGDVAAVEPQRSRGGR